MGSGVELDEEGQTTDIIFTLPLSPPSFSCLSPLLFLLAPSTVSLLPFLSFSFSPPLPHVLLQPWTASLYVQVASQCRNNRRSKISTGCISMLEIDWLPSHLRI